MTGRRIASLLPAATEMACCLGLDDQIVAITHECDYPDSIRTRPVVVGNAISLEGLSQAQIDAQVSARVAAGQSPYTLAVGKLAELKPDLILSQNLCGVCAPAENDVQALCDRLRPPPDILWMSPQTLNGIFGNMRELAHATGTARAAESWIARATECMEHTARVASTLPRPRVCFMEWLDPVYCAGHWIGEMIALAGGDDRFARPGADSVRVAWEEVVDFAPEIIVLAPCGFTLEKTWGLAATLTRHPGWADLPAVREGKVFAVDANAYFARPGPRVIEGIALLAHLFHPQHFPPLHDSKAFRCVEFA